MLLDSFTQTLYLEPSQTSGISCEKSSSCGCSYKYVSALPTFYTQRNYKVTPKILSKEVKLIGVNSSEN